MSFPKEHQQTNQLFFRLTPSACSYRHCTTYPCLKVLIGKENGELTLFDYSGDVQNVDPFIDFDAIPSVNSSFHVLSIVFPKSSAFYRLVNNLVVHTSLSLHILSRSGKMDGLACPLGAHCPVAKFNPTILPLVIAGSKCECFICDDDTFTRVDTILKELQSVPHQRSFYMR
ncbi:hypothetical protein L1987_45235 [Smallanthus sonchifolius]|nr:hypothetical protein L1987_45233 [Smallanthus sonchifolius]KAI3786108.1 hypothetical protein L1987_45235 [Smallanthus sonchifolius]